MEQFEAYIFDLDDTLYREHDYVKSGFRAVAHELGQLSNYDTNYIFKAIIDEWKESGRGRVFDVVCKKLSIDVNVGDLVSVYRNHRPQISLYEDAEILLNELKKKKKKIGVITDGHSVMQRKKIEMLLLRERVDHIVITGDLGLSNWKPSKVPYKLMIENLGLSNGKSVYIGDNPNKDFITARKLGMKTIRIVRPVGDHMDTKLSEEYEADKKIYSLLECIN